MKLPRLPTDYALIAVLVCAWAFPVGSRSRITRLERKCSELSAECSRLRASIAVYDTRIADLRLSVDSSSVVDGDADFSLSAVDSSTPHVIPGRYTCVRGVSGFLVDGDTFLIGDVSPWGLVEFSSQGLALCSGRYYRLTPSKVYNEQL